jgi:hypothetical protein
MEQNAQIDSRNLASLENLMNYEALLCKKCSHYTGSLTDPGSRELSQSLAQHHRQRYNALFDYLQSHG